MVYRRHNNILVLQVLFWNWNQPFPQGPYVPLWLTLVHNYWITVWVSQVEEKKFFIWDLVLLFIPILIYHHFIYVVVIVNLYIVTRLLNINSIKIRNMTKIGKWFIWFTVYLKSVPYFILDILGYRFIITGKCRVINLSQKVYSFSIRLVYISVYSYIVGSSSENHYLQDLVDEVFPCSTSLRMTL